MTAKKMSQKEFDKLQDRIKRGVACPCCTKRLTVKARSTYHISAQGREVTGVFECPHCGAVLGQCYKGESYSVVRPYMTSEEVPHERMRHYDLRVLGSDGISRRHGFFDIDTRLIVQVG